MYDQPESSRAEAQAVLFKVVCATSEQSMQLEQSWYLSLEVAIDGDAFVIHDCISAYDRIARVRFLSSVGVIANHALVSPEELVGRLGHVTLDYTLSEANQKVPYVLKYLFMPPVKRHEHVHYSVNRFVGEKSFSKF